MIRGQGRLAGEKTVEVISAGGTRVLHARHAVVIATGSTASIPAVPGLRPALPWTSRDVTNLREVPRRVAVIGGGVVACEAATWLVGLGTEELTIIEPGPALLAQLEPFAAGLVRRRFDELGIRTCVDTTVEEVRRPGVEDTGVGLRHGGPATVTAGGSSFEVDEIVVAAGRTPSSSDLGLDRVGVDVTASHGFIPTDDHMEVLGGRGWLYAVGDICGRALLTHMGKYQARIAGAVIARPGGGSPHRGLPVPGSGRP